MIMPYHHNKLQLVFEKEKVTVKIMHHRQVQLSIAKQPALYSSMKNVWHKPSHFQAREAKKNAITVQSH